MTLITYIDLNLDCYPIEETRDAYWSWKGKPYDSEQMAKDIEEEVAQQCYLECLAAECGEGECSKAIKSKFKL